MALTITDSQGNVIYDQQGYPNGTIDFFELCLDPEECYTATLTNLAGNDSWNGGYFWIHVGNVEWVNGTLDGASSDEIVFGTGEDCEDSVTPNEDDFVFGCTDPWALNYNPLAVFDDGSCEYEDNTGGNGGGNRWTASTVKASPPWGHLHQYRPLRGRSRLDHLGR